MDEFTLIDHFFKAIPLRRQDVLLGIGDDAASVQVPPGYELLVSTDTLVSGIHFLPDWNPYDIAFRSLMVNISDMAAMAAEPCWVTLALTLPELNQSWLEPFAKGLGDGLQQYHIDLIGGDITQGPLAINLTILGLAPKGRLIKREGAKPGDVILVSGPLGAAALAIQLLSDKTVPVKDREELMAKLLAPKPRTDLIHLLRTQATAAIDISDGLSADLNHLCVAGRVGACLTKEAIPVYPLLNKYLKDKAVDLALTGGDDYELCFTLPAKQLDSFMQAASLANSPCYPIGFIEKDKGLRIKSANNICETLIPTGYTHF